MSARDASGGRALVAAALARAEAWLLEPAEAVEPPHAIPAPPAVELRARPVVTVMGLAPRCGCTTVARALAAELGAREPGGAAVVSCAGTAGGPALGTASAGRLARALGRLADGAEPRSSGRLCLIECGDHAALADATRYLAPLVIDVGHEPTPSSAVAVADHAVAVASPGVEPALAAVVGDALAELGPRPVTVLNRAGALEGWEGRVEIVLPDSRVAAQLALSGREARGELGRAIGELAHRCEDVRPPC
jgi:hypothetical protein